jgi:hypothetical protein
MGRIFLQMEWCAHRREMPKKRNILKNASKKSKN